MMLSWVLVCCVVLPGARSYSYLLHRKLSSSSVLRCAPDDRAARSGPLVTRAADGKRGEDIPTNADMYLGDNHRLGTGSDEDVTFDLARFVAYNLLAVVIALGANFLGVTSGIMSQNPTFFRSLGVDQLYSVSGLG
jgi:hypothetical protein